MPIFVRTLTPIWIAEAMMDAVGYAMSPDTVKDIASLGAVAILNAFALCISAIVLPWFAALRVERRGGSRRLGLLGAVSVSGVAVVTIGASYIATGNSLESFEGFLVVLFVLFVPMQLVFGWLGYGYAHRNAATQI